MAGGGASYEICMSCNFEFGYDDDAMGLSYEQWRQRWINAGMPWNGVNILPPVNWNPVEQLKAVIDGDCVNNG